ncbi:two-component hybrid sensor and regulator [Beggiatoa sp. PS]|nr:two-component hybrid sensor and regulator [Beggiatoa sp. PS]
MFLTAAYKTEEFQQKGFAMGAVDYLTKPIDAPQLINRVKSYLRFIEQDHQHKQDLEQKVKERTAELLEARNILEQRVEERTAELLTAKNLAEQAQKMADADRVKAEQSQKIAEEANYAKSHFLANMSHELRTPLNAIIGYSEMLQEDAEDLNQESCVLDLKKIQGAGKHLLGLINTVLDLSKIEAGRMELYIETFELNPVLNEIVSTIQPLVEKKANVLKTVFDDNLGQMHTDLTKLRQMLLNLLSNTAKFTEQGQIRMEVRRDGEWINFCIADNGIGMTEEQQKKIFQPFTQADASTTRRYGGTGLGLAITKQFSEMMGGVIWVESEFGQGSIFMMSLPIQAKTHQLRDHSKLEQLDELKGDGIVLVIDNNVSVRALLKEDLSQLGYAVAVAENGNEGLKLAHKLHPDVILLDIHLSQNGDEWDILSSLKNEPFLASVPVILMVMEEDKQKGYALGATDCIDKTMIHSQLSILLKKYPIGENTSNLIMVVDDDDLFRDSISELLEQQGLQIVQAENGKIALESLKQNKPILILLDLNMPVMDGFEFLTHLRDNHQICSIPIVILTAKNISAEELEHLNKHQVESVFQKNALKQDKLIWQIHQLIKETSIIDKQVQI